MTNFALLNLTLLLVLTLLKLREECSIVHWKLSHLLYATLEPHHFIYVTSPDSMATLTCWNKTVYSRLRNQADLFWIHSEIPRSSLHLATSTRTSSEKRKFYVRTQIALWRKGKVSIGVWSKGRWKSWWSLSCGVEKITEGKIELEWRNLSQAIAIMWGQNGG